MFWLKSFNFNKNMINDKGGKIIGKLLAFEMNFTDISL